MTKSRKTKYDFKSHLRHNIVSVRLKAEYVTDCDADDNFILLLLPLLPLLLLLLLLLASCVLLA